MLHVPNKPDAASFEEWEQWESGAARQYPVRYFLSEYLPVALSRTWRRFVGDPWYWLKCRTWHRYNVVNCRALSSTWCDRDHLLLHSSFQILTDFVEKEQPWEFDASDAKLIKSYGEESGRLETWKEIRSLYHWWKIASHVTGRQSMASKENEMLHRLIDVRSQMWT